MDVVKGLKLDITHKHGSGEGVKLLRPLTTIGL